jgi:hypothetical protein
MILPFIHELSIVGVADVNVPNQERIIIRPTQSVNLAGFGLYIGWLKANGMITPYPDHFLWFGELFVAPPSWIIVYSGPGKFQQTHVNDGRETAYVYHWGKSHTVFGQPGIVAALFRFDGILIGPQPIVKPLLGK